MTTISPIVYKAFSSVLSSLRDFSSIHDLTEILPAAASPGFEHYPSVTFFWGTVSIPTFLLPTSSSFHKQIAAQHIGSVYCVAPCYRREPEAVLEKRRHLEVFRQIEVEISGGDMESALIAAQQLVCYLSEHFPPDIRKLDPIRINDFDSIDLSEIKESERPTEESFTDWSSDLSGSITRPTWILHTPQTYKPCLNKSHLKDLSKGFDLLLPFGYGELISGGERDIYQAYSFLGIDDKVLDPDFKSSGFGIGLERLISYFMQEEDISALTLPGENRGMTRVQ
jgi:asparaginyl-tRNA synthetase